MSWPTNALAWLSLGAARASVRAGASGGERGRLLSGCARLSGAAAHPCCPTVCVCVLGGHVEGRPQCTRAHVQVRPTARVWAACTLPRHADGPRMVARAAGRVIGTRRRFSLCRIDGPEHNGLADCARGRAAAPGHARPAAIRAKSGDALAAQCSARLLLRCARQNKAPAPDGLPLPRAPQEAGRSSALTDDAG